MSDTLATVLVTQIVLLVTTVITLWYNLYKTHRDRKWKIEDERRTEQWRNEVRSRHESTRADLAQNTEMSAAAFKEANDVNVKILQVNEELLKSRRTLDDLVSKPVLPVAAIRSTDAEPLLNQRQVSGDRRKEDREPIRGDK